MTEPRNRSRKVTRKAGPPTETETASNEAASPVFQAPVSAEPQNQQESSSHEGAESKRRSSESSQDGEHGGNRKSRSRGGRGRGRGGNANSHNFQQGGGNSNRNNNRGNNNGNNRGRRNVPKSMQGADLTKRLPEPPKQPNDALRIYALGGISEIGRNMTVFEYGDDLLIIDCGVLFPSSGEPGVDLILPDFGPIEKKLDKIKALVVTHAHEDHIGAIPWLLKLRPDIPVVASRFTIALIAAKCKEHRQKPKFVEVNEKSDVTYGPFRVRFWAVNHSIPDALGIMLGTPAGNIIHTGDIKLDQTPLDHRPTDLPALSRYGDEGVDLMLCDSTNANIPGVSASEADIPATFKRLVAGAKQRVIIASFASNVYRVQAAVDAAVANGRKVAFNGRSMMRNMEIAEKMGFLKVPRGTIIPIEEASKMAPHKTVLITTGTQGEPMAALSRMARREHRQITVRDGDLIVFSSSLIPGNEEAIYGVMNMLSQIGAEVITNKEARVHSSGHGYGGELLFLYNAARPKNAMPVHGEWRHLRANKELAISTGVRRDRVVLAQNGVVVDLRNGRAEVVGQIPVGNLYVDGVSMGDVDADTLADRTNLGAGGVVSITCVIDNRTMRLMEHPAISTTGFADDDRGVVPEVAEIVEHIMNDLAAEGENDTYRMVQKLRRKVSKLMDSKYKREPVILPTIVPTASGNIVTDDDDVEASRESL
ncbi:ribonuclease J [Corynebacterium flavescens]|uniref:Ribonuclease J n=4 Tax=Corynebacterium flavescens TaxID=28028 RepID=A0AB73B4P1_CORFL|nr:ribonuclease J [Corynebacterium flavescens]MDN6225996.1 ribonuclease J [Corynebacterium flavescens]MDN6530659.1 ribonuclease J [Corynebacterium flavescens]MDN6551588.1 ribonuclease J [Corynebacterium flavescens]MDN6645231.1 ribonuclease J [Corynebacterium flavescens]GEB96877.1 ribonuclease J [Corynebacterium flavescens]